MPDTDLLSLLQLSDPTLPIGGFSHSAGLETYVQQGLVKDAATAKEFITGMLEQNLHNTDAAFVSLSYQACENNDFKKIVELDYECTAVKLPREIRGASKKLGTRLIKIFQPVCESRIANSYKQAIMKQQTYGHYCIAFGIYAHGLNINKTMALTGFYYNAAVSMVINSVKLIPLGQQDGQQLLFSLQPLINGLVQKSLKPDVNLIGLCCTGFDLRSMQHEQLYSRLYMS